MLKTFSFSFVYIKRFTFKEFIIIYYYLLNIKLIYTIYKYVKYVVIYLKSDIIKMKFVIKNNFKKCFSEIS
jgi:hypothetical protein